MPKRQLKGKIKSLSGPKTIVVEVTRFYHHPLYRKRLRAIKRYLVHCETEVSTGQEVTIEETRPLSARKRWKVVEVGGKTVVSDKQKGRDQRSLVASDAIISEKPNAASRTRSKRKAVGPKSKTRRNKK